MSNDFALARSSASARIGTPSVPRPAARPDGEIARRVPRAAAGSAQQVARRVPRAAAGSAQQVARRLPRSQSAPVLASGERHVGQTELGRIAVDDTVIAKIASRAALEVPDVGAAASGVLSRLGGGSPAELGALPTAKASVDGQLAFVDLTLSVRYPVSVRQAAAAVREQVRTRVGELAGLDVPEVHITVPALVADLPPTRRVR